MQELRRDSKGRVVPFFVKEIDGQEPDFRITEPQRIVECMAKDICWVCGQKLGRHKAFVLGPMCAINRVNSEPPSHYDCARYSVQVCPFLSEPRMHRREAGLPDEIVQPAGLAIMRNPGAAAIWITGSYRPFPDGMGQLMIRLGTPERVEWYCQGRPATRAEVMDSINSGFPILQQYAEQDGPGAIKQLQAQYDATMPLLPLD